MKLNKTRGAVIAGATTGALALAVLGGSVAANAANNTSHKSNDAHTSSSAPARADRPVEEALTGATADSVKAAVEAAYPGATIDRMEKDADGTSVYEAHITKADGSHVTVMLDDSFAITGEEAMPAFGAHGPDGGPGATGDSKSAPKKSAKAKSAKTAKKHAKVAKKNA